VTKDADQPPAPPPDQGGGARPAPPPDQGGGARPAPPPDHLGWLLKHARERLSALSAAALDPLGITGRELAVLSVVAQGEPPSQLEAAGRLGIDRSTMVTLLDELEAKGLVERRPHRADRRRNIVQLTATGRRTFTAASRATDEVERTFLAALPESDREPFRAMLRALVDG
jgi:DNA-binding MarR family transcriptional regulator